MKTMFRKNGRLLFTTITILTLMCSLNASAQSHENTFEADSTSTANMFRNVISMCPGGIAFGIFSANYEYLFKPHQSIVLRADYETIPKSYSDANIEPYGMAFILNYRYHLEDLNSCYLGVFSRYRVYKGEGSLNAQDFDFSIPEVTLGLNVGRRWMWKSGFTLNLALGYGICIDKLKLDNPTTEIKAAIDDFRDDYDFMNGFLGEFSIGYAF